MIENNTKREITGSIEFNGETYHYTAESAEWGNGYSFVNIIEIKDEDGNVLKNWSPDVEVDPMSTEELLTSDLTEAIWDELLRGLKRD